LIDKGVSGPDVHRLLAFAHLKGGSFDAAISELNAARAVHTNAGVEVAFGRYLNGEGFKEAALNCFQAAVGLDAGNADALALICMHHVQRQQSDLARQYGQKALEARDRQAMATPDIRAVPPSRPTAFDPTSPGQNIIAYSLFGMSQYYWECALTAAAMAYAIFPEWRCRFYCDSKVPKGVLQQLGRLRAQVFISPQDSTNWSGLFWRFFAFDDPKVNVVMIRDVDSPFTVRERLAVDAWLASTAPFHVIRDHYNHCEPMMAGLWGGWTRLLPPLHGLARDFRVKVKGRFADQEFLRLNVWPRIRQATLAHDRFYRLGDTRPPPSHPTETHTHIGMGWPRRGARPAGGTPR